MLAQVTPTNVDLESPRHYEAAPSSPHDSVARFCTATFSHLEPLRMASKDLGNKHVCVKCSTKFYDLKKPDPVCPKCGADQREVAPKPEGRRSRLSAVPKIIEPVEPVEKEESDELEDEEEEVEDEEV